MSRSPEGGVTVVPGDGRALPFPDGRFDAIVCFTMLHHVPSETAQDLLVSEAVRVLRPGGVVAGSDSTDSIGLRAYHFLDTYVPVEPHSFAGRLTAAGFADVRVERRPQLPVVSVQGPPAVLAVR